MNEPEFGAGLWNFATYKDRYASDGYGDPRSTLDQLDLAAATGDIRWVDITYPFTPGVSLADVKAALARVQGGADIDMAALARALYTALDARNLQVALDDPTAAALLAQRG